MLWRSSTRGRSSKRNGLRVSWSDQRTKTSAAGGDDKALRVLQDVALDDFKLAAVSSGGGRLCVTLDSDSDDWGSPRTEHDEGNRRVNNTYGREPALDLLGSAPRTDLEWSRYEPMLHSDLLHQSRSYYGDTSRRTQKIQKQPKHLARSLHLTRFLSLGTTESSQLAVATAQAQEKAMDTVRNQCEFLVRKHSDLLISVDSVLILTSLDMPMPGIALTLRCRCHCHTM